MYSCTVTQLTGNDFDKEPVKLITTLCHKYQIGNGKNAEGTKNQNKASQAIQSPRTVPFFLLVSLLDGYSFPNVLVKGIVAFKHLKKTATLTSITDL